MKKIKHTHSDEKDDLSLIEKCKDVNQLLDLIDQNLSDIKSKLNQTISSDFFIFRKVLNYTKNLEDEFVSVMRDCKCIKNTFDVLESHLFDNAVSKIKRVESLRIVEKRNEMLISCLESLSEVQKCLKIFDAYFTYEDDIETIVSNYYLLKSKVDQLSGNFIKGSEPVIYTVYYEELENRKALLKDKLRSIFFETFQVVVNCRDAKISLHSNRRIGELLFREIEKFSLFDLIRELAKNFIDLIEFVIPDDNSRGNNRLRGGSDYLASEVVLIVTQKEGYDTMNIIIRQNQYEDRNEALNFVSLFSNVSKIIKFLDKSLFYDVRGECNSQSNVGKDTWDSIKLLKSMFCKIVVPTIGLRLISCGLRKNIPEKQDLLPKYRECLVSITLKFETMLIDHEWVVCGEGDEGGQYRVITHFTENMDLEYMARRREASLSMARGVITNSIEVPKLDELVSLLEGSKLKGLGKVLRAYREHRNSEITHSYANEKGIPFLTYSYIFLVGENFFVEQLSFAKCSCRAMTIFVCALCELLLAEALTANNGRCTDVLIRAIHEIVELYLILEVQERPNTEFNMTNGMVFRNDCAYLAYKCTQFSIKFRSFEVQNRRESRFLPFLNAVPQLGDAAKKSYSNVVNAVKVSLNQILSKAKGFVNTHDKDRYSSCSSVIKDLVLYIRNVNKCWVPILSEDLLKLTMGDIVQAVLRQIIDSIFKMSEIDDFESRQLSVLLKPLLSLSHLFKAELADDLRSAAAKYVQSWNNLEDLVDVLPLTMAEIFQLYSENRLSFSRDQLLKLFVALFEDSRQRKSYINLISTR